MIKTWKEPREGEIDSRFEIGRLWDANGQEILSRVVWFNTETGEVKSIIADEGKDANGNWTGECEFGMKTHPAPLRYHCSGSKSDTDTPIII